MDFRERAEYCFESTVSEERTHWVLRQTRWVLRKTRWVRFGTQIIGWEELTELAPRNSVSPEKLSLSSVFETVLSETVFSPFPRFGNLKIYRTERHFPRIQEPLCSYCSYCSYCSISISIKIWECKNWPGPVWMVFRRGAFERQICLFRGL